MVLQHSLLKITSSSYLLLLTPNTLGNFNQSNLILCALKARLSLALLPTVPCCILKSGKYSAYTDSKSTCANEHQPKIIMEYSYL